MPDAARERDERGDEDRASTSEPFVERMGKPAGDEAAAELTDDRQGAMLTEHMSDVRRVHR